MVLQRQNIGMNNKQIAFKRAKSTETVVLRGTSSLVIFLLQNLFVRLVSVCMKKRTKTDGREMYQNLKNTVFLEPKLPPKLQRTRAVVDWSFKCNHGRAPRAFRASDETRACVQTLPKSEPGCRQLCRRLSGRVCHPQSLVRWRRDPLLYIVSFGVRMLTMLTLAHLVRVRCDPIFDWDHAE